MLDHVLQLADVAPPRVAAQRADGGLRQPRRGSPFAAVPGPVGREEVLRQERDVLGPLAQRRDDDRHDAQAIIQVFPQVPALEGGVGVAVGRRDEADVHDRVRRLAPHPPHHAVLDHPQ